MQSTLLCWSLLGLSIFGACSEDKSFQAGAVKPSESPPPAPPVKAVVPPEPLSAPAEPAPSAPEPAEEKKDSFPLTVTAKKLDMVWVIDNSESMKEEAAQVRNNFSKFLSSLGAQTDLNLALMSTSEGATGVSLPPEAMGKGHIHINAFVGSLNGLAIAASASCPEAQSAWVGIATPPVATTPVQPGPILYPDTNNVTLCAKTFDLKTNRFDPVGSRRKIMESPDVALAVRGRLTSFFRPNALRAYVFVTDDDAGMVSEQNFLEMVQPTYGGKRPYVFAFRGIENNGAGCTVAAKGVAYEALAAATGGGFYDICQPDWSVHFKKLSESVESIAKNQFALSEPKRGLAQVRVDGKDVGPERWRVDAGILILQPDALSATAKLVEAFYKP